MQDGDRWLTYREGAEALGMSPGAVAARARRARWPKRLRDDGAAEILVPTPLLESPPTSGPTQILTGSRGPWPVPSLPPASILGNGRRPTAVLDAGPALETLQQALVELTKTLERETAARKAAEAQVENLREEVAKARVANAVAQQQISAERERRERAIKQLLPLERKVQEYEDRQKRKGFVARLLGA